MADVDFALVLNLHQPAYNLEDLLGRHEWEASEILRAMDRIPRSLWAYEDVGLVHLSLSGSLPETLASPDFERRVYGIVDCGSLLWYLQSTRIIHILGPDVYWLLEQAYWRVLRAETSCNFFWGEAWLPRCHDDLDGATHFLDQAGSRMSSSIRRPPWT